MKKLLASIFLLTLFTNNVASAATLNFDPSQTTVAVGQEFSVDILLDTKGSAVDGVDIYSMHFDPKILEVIQVIPGTDLALTLINTFDNTKGTLQFSQVVMGSTTFTGVGKIATIRLKSKTEGSGNLSFDSKSGSTADTNVASGGKDILTSVGSSSIKVGSSNPTPSPSPSTPTSGPSDVGPTPIPTPPPTAPTLESVPEASNNNFLWLTLLIALILIGGGIFINKIINNNKENGQNDNQ